MTLECGSAPPNKFIEVVKEENRHNDNLQLLRDNKKLSGECAESVQETLDTRYRYELYITLNRLDQPKQWTRKRPR